MSFLALVARSTGKLKKGGIPNTDMAARSVLHDWNDGKIKYYCIPPAVAAKASGASSASTEDAKIVQSFSAELNIDQLAEGVLGALDSQQRGVDESIYVGISEVGAGFSDDLDDHPMESTETVVRSSSVAAPKKATKAPVKRKSTTATSSQPYDFDADFK